MALRQFEYVSDMTSPGTAGIGGGSGNYPTFSGLVLPPCNDGNQRIS